MPGPEPELDLDYIVDRVRKQARRAALEEAAEAIEKMPGDEAVEGTTTYSLYNEALEDAAHHLRQLAEEGGA